MNHLVARIVMLIALFLVQVTDATPINSGIEWSSQIQYPDDTIIYNASFYDSYAMETSCSYAGARTCLAERMRNATNGACFYLLRNDGIIYSTSSIWEECQEAYPKFYITLLQCNETQDAEERRVIDYTYNLCNCETRIREMGGYIPVLANYSAKFINQLCFPFDRASYVISPQQYANHFRSLCKHGFCASSAGQAYSSTVCDAYCDDFALIYTNHTAKAEAMCASGSPLCGLAQNVSFFCAHWTPLSSFPGEWIRIVDGATLEPVYTECAPGYPYEPPCDQYRGCKGNNATDCSSPNMTCVPNASLLPLQKECVCPSGWRGTSCSEPADCSTFACVNGTCNTTTYACACDAGFEGERCDTPVDDCRNHSCVHGTCIDQHTAYACVCDAGWDGIYCDQNKNECATAECGAFGECVDVFNGHRCECLSGWNNQQPSDPCTIQVPCAEENEYLDSDAKHCLPCHTTCEQCDGPLPVQCTACGLNYTLTVVTGNRGECVYEQMDAQGFTLTQDIWMAMLLLCLAYTAIGVVYLLLRWKHADADNFAVVTYGVSVINTATDIAFAISIVDLQPLFITCITFICVTAVFNAVGTAYFFVRYMKDVRVGAWVEENHSLVTMTVFLGIATIQALRFISSHILDIDKLKLVFPEYAMTRVKILSVVSLFIQDLPQVIVQILYTMTYSFVNVYVVVSIAASMVSFVFGIASRVFLCMAIVRKEQRVDMLQTPSPNNDMGYSATLHMSSPYVNRSSATVMQGSTSPPVAPSLSPPAYAPTPSSQAPAHTEEFELTLMQPQSASSPVASVRDTVPFPALAHTELSPAQAVPSPEPRSRAPSSTRQRNRTVTGMIMDAMRSPSTIARRDQTVDPLRDEAQHTVRRRRNIFEVFGDDNGETVSSPSADQPPTVVHQESIYTHVPRGHTMRREPPGPASLSASPPHPGFPAPPPPLDPSEYRSMADTKI